MAEVVTFGEGTVPVKDRWPFATLEKGKYFEVTDLTKHTALRTAASRANKKLGKTFSVRKVTLTPKGKPSSQVIRVYLE